MYFKRFRAYRAILEELGWHHRFTRAFKAASEALQGVSMHFKALQFVSGDFRGLLEGFTYSQMSSTVVSREPHGGLERRYKTL